MSTMYIMRPAHFACAVFARALEQVAISDLPPSPLNMKDALRFGGLGTACSLEGR